MTKVSDLNYHRTCAVSMLVASKSILGFLTFLGTRNYFAILAQFVLCFQFHLRQYWICLLSQKVCLIHLAAFIKCLSHEASEEKQKEKTKRVCVCSHSHLFLGRCKTMLTHTGGRFEQMLTRLRTRLLTVLRITLASICGFIIDYSLTRYLYLFLLILDRYAITLRNILILGM